MRRGILLLLNHELSMEKKNKKKKKGGETEKKLEASYRTKLFTPVIRSAKIPVKNSRLENLDRILDGENKKKKKRNERKVSFFPRLRNNLPFNQGNRVYRAPFDIGTIDRNRGKIMEGEWKNVSGGGIWRGVEVLETPFIGAGIAREIYRRNFNRASRKIAASYRPCGASIAEENGAARRKGRPLVFHFAFRPLSSF